MGRYCSAAAPEPLRVYGRHEVGLQTERTSPGRRARRAPGGLFAAITDDAKKGAKKLTLEHLFDIHTDTVIRVRDRGDGVETHKVVATDREHRTVTLEGELDQDVRRGEHVVEIHAQNAEGAAALRVQARSTGAWGDALSVRLRAMAGSSYRLLPADPTTPLVSTTASAQGNLNDTLQLATTLGDAAPDRVRVHGRVFEVADYTAPTAQVLDANGVEGTAAAPATLKLTDGPDEEVDVGERIAVARSAMAVGDDKVRVWGASTLYPGAIVEFDNGANKTTLTVASVTGDTATLAEALSAGATYFDDDIITVVEAGVSVRYAPEDGPVVEEPANEVIRSITGFERQVVRREQDMLNPNGINVLRAFPGRGRRVWGARTLSSDGSWKYINVRRLFLYVEESIDEGTQWVVFEPNDEPLWARVRQTIRNFLTTVWRSGALQGRTADEAFFLKCDRTTRTQDDIDNGRLICLIGIAPVKPAEFVIFRIQQKTLSAESG